MFSGYGVYTWPVSIGGEDTLQTVKRWSGTGDSCDEGYNKWIMFLAVLALSSHQCFSIFQN